MKKIIYIVILVVCLAGCRTSKVVNTSDVERINSGTITKMDTTTTRYILNVIERYHRDTIVERLITQEEIIKNAITERVDTLYIVKEQAVKEQVNTDEVVPKKSKTTQATSLIWAIAALLVVIVLAVVSIRRYFK